MRSHLPVLLLLLFCIWSSPVAAQSPDKSQSSQLFPQKPLSVTKQGSERSKTLFLKDATLLNPAIDFHRSKLGVHEFGEKLEHSPNTAHILVWLAPPDLDQSMILDIPKDFSSNMPIIKGLPPFSGDIRGVFDNQSLLSTKPFSFPNDGNRRSELFSTPKP